MKDANNRLSLFQPAPKETQQDVFYYGPDGTAGRRCTRI